MKTTERIRCPACRNKTKKIGWYEKKHILLNLRLQLKCITLCLLRVKSNFHMYNKCFCYIKPTCTKAFTIL